MLTEVLWQYGANVAAADNVDAAFDAVSNDDLDLIVCDIDMPVIDGHQLLWRIRKIKRRLSHRLDRARSAGSRGSGAAASSLTSPSPRRPPSRSGSVQKFLRAPTQLMTLRPSPSEQFASSRGQRTVGQPQGATVQPAESLAMAKWSCFRTSSSKKALVPTAYTFVLASRAPTTRYSIRPTVVTSSPVARTTLDRARSLDKRQVILHEGFRRRHQLVSTLAGHELPAEDRKPRSQRPPLLRAL